MCEDMEKIKTNRVRSYLKFLYAGELNLYHDIREKYGKFSWQSLSNQQRTSILTKAKENGYEGI